MFGFFRNHVKATNVTIDEAHDLIINNEEVLILDVRTEAEFKEGHIVNAINIPHNVLLARINELHKFKDRMILVHCQAGGRSVTAVNILEQNGFTRVYHMHKGFMAWKFEVIK